jgi:hypothetical protein
MQASEMFKVAKGYPIAKSDGLTVSKSFAKHDGLTISKSNASK